MLVLTEHLDEIVATLKRSGLDAFLEGPRGPISVGRRGRGDDAPTALIVFDQDLYEEYLTSISRDSAKDDLWGAAAEFQVMTERFLIKDHGGGVNRVELISLARGPAGSVGFKVEEASTPNRDLPLGDDNFEWRSERPEEGA